MWTLTNTAAALGAAVFLCGSELIPEQAKGVRVN